MSVDTNSVQTINLLETVFGRHYCGHRANFNPEYIKLKNQEYQDDYFEVQSAKSGESLGVYMNGFEEIISEKEFVQLPKKPERLIELEAEIYRCQTDEAKAGIIHGHFEAFKKIPVPKLIFNDLSHTFD